MTRSGQPSSSTSRNAIPNRETGARRDRHPPETSVKKFPSSLLESAGKVVGDARLCAAFLEGPLVLVPVQKAWRHVASDVDIGPAIVIEVGRCNSQRVAASRFQNSRFLRDVGECS